MSSCLTFAFLTVKRPVIYLLLMLICFQSGGFLFLFKIRQWNIREEMEHGGHEMVSLSIPASSYYALVEREGKEICWQGKRYDIKSLQTQGGIILLKAVWDKKEQSLISGFSDWLKQSTGSDKVLPGIIKLLTLEFYRNSEPLMPPVAGTVTHVPSKIEQVLRGFPGLCLHPPRLA